MVGNVLKFRQIIPVKNRKQLLKIRNGIQFRYPGALYPNHLSLGRGTELTRKILSFEQKYQIAALVNGKLLEATEPGVKNLQPGFFLHFSNDRIHNGLSRFHMPAGKGIPLPIGLDTLLKKNLAAPVNQTQNGQFDRFPTLHTKHHLKKIIVEIVTYNPGFDNMKTEKCLRYKEKCFL